VPLPDATSAPDVAGSCLGCRTIFLLPRKPLDPGIAGGRAAAALCPRCGGLVVAVDACTERLRRMVATVRSSDVRRYATVRALAMSWRAVEPSPLAALAELGPVSRELVRDLGVTGAPINVRIAVGVLLLSVLVPLLDAAATDEEPDAAARRILADRVAATAATPVPQPA
jgi:hypothetical protein